MNTSANYFYYPIDQMFKATLILVLAFALSFILRRRSAAQRHAVLSLAMLSLIFLSASVYLPQIKLPISAPITIPQIGSHGWLDLQYHGKTLEGNTPLWVEMNEGAPSRLSPYTTAPLKLSRSPQISLSDELLLQIPAIWIIGFCVLIGQFAIGIFRAGKLRKQSSPADLRTDRLMDDAARLIGLSKPVTVLMTSSTTLSPLTFGTTKPVVLLPSTAIGWSDDELSMVLLHEAAHIKRNDWLIQSVAAFASALFCINPLVWFAYRNLRAEAELACDDIVINAGVTPIAYSTTLIDIVKETLVKRKPQYGAVAMASSSNVGNRIKAILSKNVDRNQLSRQGAVGLAVAALLVTGPIIAIKTVESSNGSTSYATSVDSSNPGDSNWQPSVEAISRFGNENKGWWNMSRQDLPEAPEAPNIPTFSLPPQPGHTAYQFVVKVQNLPVGTDGIVYKLPGATSSVEYSDDDSEIKQTEAANSRVYSLAGQFSSGKTTASVAVGVESGIWTDDLSIAAGQSQSASVGFSPGQSMIYTVIHPAPLNVVVTDTDQPGVDSRIVAIKTDGTLVMPDVSDSQSQGTLELRTLTFNGLNQSDIKSIVLQSSPYVWKQIDNIPLSPRG